jgi:outer membrane protein
MFALARAEGPPALSLADAVQLAVARNPDHTSAVLAEQIAAIEARRARLDRFSATVSADAGAHGGVVVPWGAPAYAATDASWDLRASASLPLYAGGAIRASIDAADANQQIAAEDQAITDRALVRAAYTAYWTIKGYELQIAAAEEGLALTRQSLDIVNAKANAGLAAGIDVNRSRVDLLSQEESLVSARGALYAAEQDLLQLLHLPGDELVLTDDPPEPQTGAPSLGADPGEDRPELRRKALEATAADAAVRAARAGTLPTVALTGTAGVGNSAVGTEGSAFDAADLQPQFDAAAGITFSWNVFDLFDTRDAVAQARLRARQVEAATEAERAAIEADIRAAADAVRSLRERVPLVDAQVALARDNLQIVQSLYSQGSATILDLFDAQSAFRSARVQGASLRVQLATAEYDLRWMLGQDPTGASR